METVRTSCGLCHRVGPFPSPKSWQRDKPAHACVYDDYPPAGGSPELVANARLMAASPELLDALSMLLEVHDAMGAGQSHAATKARDAIAKAEGRS
jgi:hypothetical protein